MKSLNEYFLSHSYFWDCFTLSEDCVFFRKADSKLLYFGIGLTSLYLAFLLMIIADLKFYWSLDQCQKQIDYHVNYLRKKVTYIQMNQQKLMSTKEKTEKQLKRSEECKRIVTVLRAAIAENPSKVRYITDETENSLINESPLLCDGWHESQSTLEFST